MVERPHLTRYVSQDVTLMGDLGRPGGVTLAFSERTGGFSKAPYASLNVGDSCGDDADAVVANRRRLLAAIGIAELEPRLVNPVQVHGSDLVIIPDGADATVARAQAQARAGADGVVCAAADVPVLLCAADCVPVVLVAPGAFAVVHSGWKGSLARIAAKAAHALTDLAGCSVAELLCYLGPHVGAADYEVSAEMVQGFVDEFGAGVAPDATHLDLGEAVRRALTDVGVPDEAILDECPSTASCTERYYSYRAEGGVCGRLGALAVLYSNPAGR